MDEQTINQGGGQQRAAKIATGVATVFTVLALSAGAAMAQAAPDAAVVSSATDGGELMADTLRAIGMALIPLAIGVLVVKRGWRIVKGFF